MIATPVDAHADGLPAPAPRRAGRQWPDAKSERYCVLAVVPPDVAHSAAVRRAAELARRAGGTLHLRSFVYDVWLDAAGDETHVGELAGRAFVEQAEHRLCGLAAELAHDDFSIEYDVTWAPAAHEAILVEQRRLGADLVVKDVQHESVLRRALFTPLDWQLIRLLPCELMLVGPDAPAVPRRVLAAVDVLAVDAATADETSLNPRILRAAQRVAEACSTRLDLVSVAPEFPASGRVALGSALERDLQQLRHLEVFRDFSRAAGVPSDRRHRLLGAPAPAIARLAEELAADLVVVGSTYRSIWERLLLGSTAEALVREAHGDLLVIKPAHHAELTRRRFDYAAAERRLQRGRRGHGAGQLA